MTDDEFNLEPIEVSSMVREYRHQLENLLRQINEREMSASQSSFIMGHLCVRMLLSIMSMYESMLVPPDADGDLLQ